MIACRDCGTENPEVATFCRNARCGAFLGWHSAGDAATAPLPVAREAEDVDRVQELFVGVAPRGTARADPAGTPGVDLWVHPAAVEVEPGAPALIELRVHNSGTVVDRITITVEGDAAPWATVVVGGPAEAAPRPSGDANLYPGDGASATISLDPPRDPPARAGMVRLVVRARSSEDPAVSATRHVTVVVRRFREMRGALVPREASGRRAHHVLTLTNAGNASLEPAVRVVDENNALAARVDPAFPAFPPGRSQKVDVHVRPRRRKWVGAAQTYRYRVVAHEDGVAPVELDASLTQRAFVPGWAVRLAALAAPLAAAVIAFVMLWTVVPGVEGLPAAAAVDDLEEAGLESTVVRRHSATVEEGTVLGSEPEGGIRVREGSKVKLFVSSGPRPVPIPNVVGLDAASARLELSSMGLAIEEKAEESEEVEPGLVVATRPVANLLVPPGSKVQMIVAAPPEGKGGKGAEDEGSGSGSDGGGTGSEEGEAGGEDEERGRGGRAPYWTSSVASNDFDGDGAADLALFRPSTGAWHVRFGPGRVRTVDWARQRGNDVPVPGDYDGDGSTDFATWRPSDATWYVRYAGSKGHEVAELGRPGDVPVPGDYDGDGRTDMAAFGADDGRWRIRPSSGDGSGVRDVEWGDRSLGDLPVPGDYDGDGRTDLAYYRASTGRWRVAFGAGGAEAVRWGDPLEGDVPVPGDYDGDGTHDYAVWRPQTGEWRIRPSGRGESLFVTWGRRDLLDVPVPGDYTGDGTFDLAVWRESTRAWRIRPAEGTKRRIHYWGRAGDVPL